jgi:osmotically inducible protein OsmC
VTVSSGRTIWEGNLGLGKGSVTAASSAIFADKPVSWASRSEEADGRTSPEELLAVAHSTCFAMQLAHMLNRGGTPPRSLDVTASVTFEETGEAGAMPMAADPATWTITASEIVVTGSVPGLDQAAFGRVVALAKDLCPISRALKGNVKINTRATLA